MVIKLSFEKDVANRLFQVSSKDIMSLYDFSQIYCESFGDSKDLVAKTRWPVPIMNDAPAIELGKNLFLNLDTNNLEGFLNIELPNVKESLEVTFKRLNGQKSSKKSSSNSDEVKFI